MATNGQCAFGNTRSRSLVPTRTTTQNAWYSSDNGPAAPLENAVVQSCVLLQRKSLKKWSSKEDVNEDEVGDMDSWEYVASGDIGLPPGSPHRLTVWRSRYNFMIMQSQPLCWIACSFRDRTSSLSDLVRSCRYFLLSVSALHRSARVSLHTLCFWRYLDAATRFRCKCCSRSSEGLQWAFFRFHVRFRPESPGWLCAAVGDGWSGGRPRGLRSVFDGRSMQSSLSKLLHVFVLAKPIASNGA
jgi:hypothetical protein